MPFAVIVRVSNLEKLGSCGSSQAELSELSRVKYKYFQEIEGKNPPNLRVDTLGRIAKALRMPLWKLLKFNFPASINPFVIIKREVIHR